MRLKKINIRFFSFTILRLANLLSFDVALGTLAMGFLATKVLDCTPALSWWIILPVAVWLIYTADHLSDAIKTRNVETPLRYSFHLKYFKLLAAVGLMVACVTIIYAFVYLPSNILYVGILISLFTLIYMLYNGLNKTQPLPKEVIIATLYTIGIWFGPLLVVRTISWWVLFPILITFFTGFNNLLLFTIYGSHEDANCKFTSLSTVFGIQNCIKLFKISLFLSIIASVSFGFLFKDNYTMLLVSLIFLSINSTMWYIIKHRTIFAFQDNYRLLGDGIFILPFVLNLV